MRFPVVKLKLTSGQLKHVTGWGSSMIKRCGLEGVLQDLAGHPIRIMNDFAGSEAVMVAMSELQIAVDHVASCDCAPGPMKWIGRNFTPRVFHADVFKRQLNDVEPPGRS